MWKGYLLMQTRNSRIDQDQRAFNRTSLRFLIGATIVALLTLIASASHAQSEFDAMLSHRALKYTNLMTAGPLVVNEGECVPLIPTTFFDYPGARGTTCSVAIQISTQYLGLTTPGWNADIAAAVVSLKGESVRLSPVNSLAVASEVDRIWTDNTVGMILVADGITRGGHHLHMCLAQSPH
jgi:hypothetical protein